MDKSNSLKTLKGFSDKSRPRTAEGKKINALYEGRELILNVFKSRIFPIKSTQGKGHSSDLARVAKIFDLTQLKKLTPKQMFQRITIALAQVKAGNTSENLLNEIGQLIYSIY